MTSSTLVRSHELPKGFEQRIAMTSQVQEGTILLGKYRVEKELGRGAMGYVVAARHEHLGELFAVKLMLPEALERPDAAARFLREARACARIKSEHVVRVTDSGEHEPGMPVMVMEYLVGEDLQTIIDNRKVFPLSEAVTYVLQACDAIAEAHEIGIVHRDLKPSNLFLTRRPNGKPCVKVLDFGISKDLNPSGEKVAKLTATGSVMGTPCYMPPEQMQAQPTDNRSDIWSLGVILYEFVTGKLPFPGETYASVAGRVLYEQPSPPSRIRPGVPLQFDSVIMRCLEKNPDKRFASVRELMAALEPLSLLSSRDVLAISEADAARTAAEADKETLLDKDSASRQHARGDEAEKPTLLVAPFSKESVDSSPAVDDPSNRATSFYANRVITNRTGKTSTASSRPSQKLLILSALFAFGSISLLGASWFYREQIRAFAISRGIGTPPPSASAQPEDAPDGVASSAPSVPLVTPSGTVGTSKPVAAPQTAPRHRGSATASSSVGAPSSSAGAPSSSAGAPSSSAGAPSSSAGAPSSSAGAPSSSAKAAPSASTHAP